MNRYTYYIVDIDGYVLLTVSSQLTNRSADTEADFSISPLLPVIASQYGLAQVFYQTATVSQETLENAMTHQEAEQEFIRQLLEAIRNKPKPTKQFPRKHWRIKMIFTMRDVNRLRMDRGWPKDND